jgi:polyhydroxybutyrate depolymerase
MHRASADTIRRLIGISGIVLSGLIILSVIAYVAGARPGPLSAAVRHFQPAKSVVPPAPVCTTPPHPLGDSNGSIMSAGLKRTFLVHLPPSYGKHPQPLVISYHGYSWTTQIMEHNTRTNIEADKAGFVLVFPQGVDSPPSWNAGVGAYGPTGDANDIQFTRDLLTYLERNYCVDAHRVYITGFSLGGGMAYRVACTLSDQIAAVATVSGAYYPFPGGCHPSRPLPVLEIHGAADQLAPYDGNPAAHMASVQAYLNVWLTADRCSAVSDVFFQQGDVTATKWTHCAPGTEVVHYRVSDGGHTWPGTPNTTHVIDANVVIWQFFSQFSH